MKTKIIIYFGNMTTVNGCRLIYYANIKYIMYNRDVPTKSQHHDNIMIH